LYLVEKLRAVAKELGVSVSQLALRWLISQPGVTTALVGARTPEEIAENADATGWDLDPKDLARVQDISDELYITMPYYYDMWENWSTWNRRGPQREV
jgi:aryl-alcohol dehydrogenase-like predicted oxidoreductase